MHLLPALALGLSLIVLVAIPDIHAEVRTLTDKQGRSVKAEVISVENNIAKIKREDGVSFNLPLGQLIEADQKSLLEWAKAQKPANSQPPVPEPAQTPLTEPTASLQKSFARFPLLVPKTDSDGYADYESVVFNKQPLMINGKPYDGFRFKYPDKKNLDFAWMFSAPENLHEWYILPESGSMTGFDEFFRLPTGTIAQALPANRMKPGQTYLVWFRFSNKTPVEMFVKFSFAQLEENETNPISSYSIKNALIRSTKE